MSHGSQFATCYIVISCRGTFTFSFNVAFLEQVIFFQVLSSPEANIPRELLKEFIRNLNFLTIFCTFYILHFFALHILLRRVAYPPPPPANLTVTLLQFPGVGDQRSLRGSALPLSRTPPLALCIAVCHQCEGQGQQDDGDGAQCFFTPRCAQSRRNRSHRSSPSWADMNMKWWFWVRGFVIICCTNLRESDF